MGVERVWPLDGKGVGVSIGMIILVKIETKSADSGLAQMFGANFKEG